MEESFKYLLRMRKQKGREIKYKCLNTCEYLLPNKYITTTEDQQLLFSLRNKTYKLSDSYNSNNKELCICKQETSLAHIYECTILNRSNYSVKYEQIYNGTLKEQVTILNRMKENLKCRDKLKVILNPLRSS